MNLDQELLPSYLKLHHPDLPPRALHEKHREFLQKISEGSHSFDDYFVTLDSGRNVIWSLKVFPVQTGIYYAIPPRQRMGHPLAASEFKGLIEAVTGRCIQLKALSVRLRLEKDAANPMMPVILGSLGYSKLHERVEFKRLVADLPAETGTPLKWEKVSTSGPLDLEQAALILGRAAQGDPDCSPDDDPRQLLKFHLAAEGLYGELDAIQVGFCEGRSAMIAIAQVNRETGWSRITYMGILPEFRGRGLGKWLHRHGFSMMKAQGGREYHGGTVSTNAAMIRLFHSHACREHRTTEEWLRTFRACDYP